MNIFLFSLPQGQKQFQTYMKLIDTLNNIIVKQQAWQLTPLIKDHMQWPIMSISQCTKMAGAPAIYSLSFFFFSFFFFFLAEWPTKYYKNQNCL